jgi:hypothetical protein
MDNEQMDERCLLRIEWVTLNQARSDSFPSTHESCCALLGRCSRPLCQVCMKCGAQTMRNSCNHSRNHSRNAVSPLLQSLALAMR